jgi:hypothetical protein
MPLLTELDRASGAVVTINVPLLTELAVCVAEDACKVQAKAALPEDAQGQIIFP